LCARSSSPSRRTSSPRRGAGTLRQPTPAPLTLSADLTKLSDGTTEFVFAPATGE
jgi:hypothetical protein